MERVERNVRDIKTEDRKAVEQLLDESLRDDQRLLIQVFDAGEAASLPMTGSQQPQTLSDWTSVYEGLSDDEIATMDKIVESRAKLTRDVP